jgi:hypothetical protein
MIVQTIHQLCFHPHVGFQCITINCNIYVRWHGASFIIIALYVDDAILVYNTLFLLQHIKIELQSTFVMIDHGAVQGSSFIVHANSS